MMSAHSGRGRGVELSASELQAQYASQGRYTAGVATAYETGPLTGEPTWQHQARGFGIGERFHSAGVVRLSDAKPMHLGHVARADGRWRLYAFADSADIRSQGSVLRDTCERLLNDPRVSLHQFGRAGADIDEVVDVRAVLQQSCHEIAPPDLPELLLPAKGPLGLLDYTKAFTAAGGTSDIYEQRAVDRRLGALVLVRPDQYVAHVLPLDGLTELTNFLARFLKRPL